jgi:peroxiredoxin
MRPRPFLVSASALLASLPCPAQHPSVGKDAPPIQAASWLNWQGDAPTLEKLKGRVVLLEFWGTWCGPCVRAMPGVQKLHDRYTDRGLTVLAISYETSDKMQPFLTQNAFTMPVGSDPDKKTIGAYPISGWPTTVIIGKDGKIAHVGSPYDAEAAVEKALGLEAGEGAVLTAYFGAQKQADKQKKRDAIDRLVEKATPKFDVAAWAKGHLPAETVADGGAPAPAPATPAKPAVKPGNPVEALGKCSALWADAAQRTAVLQQLALVTEPIDLAAFAQQAMAKAFPFDAAELNTLLKDKKYAAVLDAIGVRAPAAAVLAAAAKNADLAAFCKSKAGEVRTNAKKAIMAQQYVFANALPKDQEVNKQFWSELSVSGWSMSEDKKQITGIMIGGEHLPRDHATAFIRSQLARTFLMEDLGAGKPPRIKELPKLIDELKHEIVRDLESRYGKPEPFVPQEEPKK